MVFLIQFYNFDDSMISKHINIMQYAYDKEKANEQRMQTGWRSMREVAGVVRRVAGSRVTNASRSDRRTERDPPRKARTRTHRTTIYKCRYKYYSIYLFYLLSYYK